MGCNYSDGVRFPEEIKAYFTKEMFLSLRSRIFNRIFREYLQKVEGRSWKKWKSSNHKWFIGASKGSLPNGRAVIFNGDKKMLAGALFEHGKVYRDSLYNFRILLDGSMNLGHLDEKGKMSGFGIKYFPCRRFRGIFLSDSELPNASYLTISLPEIETNPKMDIQNKHSNDVSHRESENDQWNTFFFYYPQPTSELSKNKEANKKALNKIMAEASHSALSHSNIRSLRDVNAAEEDEKHQKHNDKRNNQLKIDGKVVTFEDEFPEDRIDFDHAPDFLKKSSIRSMSNLKKSSIKKEFSFCPTICPANQVVPGEAGPFTFHGYFVDDVYQGRGELRGLYNTYLGYFQKGQMKGKAQEINYLQEVIYIGDFDKNKKNGEGTLYDFEQNVILQGKWQDDLFKGVIEEDTEED